MCIRDSFSKTAKISDLTGGIELYKMVADLEEHFEEKKEELKATLKRLVKEIFVRERLMLNITCAGGTTFLEKELQELLESLPSDKTLSLIHILTSPFTAVCCRRTFFSLLKMAVICPAPKKIPRYTKTEIASIVIRA